MTGTHAVIVHAKLKYWFCMFNHADQ